MPRTQPMQSHHICRAAGRRGGERQAADASLFRALWHADCKGRAQQARRSPRFHKDVYNTATFLLHASTFMPGRPLPCVRDFDFFHCARLSLVGTREAFGSVLQIPGGFPWCAASAEMRCGSARTRPDAPSATFCSSTVTNATVLGPARRTAMPALLRRWWSAAQHKSDTATTWRPRLLADASGTVLTMAAAHVILVRAGTGTSNSLDMHWSCFHSSLRQHS